MTDFLFLFTYSVKRNGTAFVALVNVHRNLFCLWVCCSGFVQSSGLVAYFSHNSAAGAFDLFHWYQLRLVLYGQIITPNHVIVQHVYRVYTSDHTGEKPAPIAIRWDMEWEKWQP